MRSCCCEIKMLLYQTLFGIPETCQFHNLEILGWLSVFLILNLGARDLGRKSLWNLTN